MAEKKTVRTRNVAFRVTSEEYEQVEKLAAEAGLDPNTWCRKVLVAPCRKALAWHGMSGYSTVKLRGCVTLWGMGSS